MKMLKLNILKLVLSMLFFLFLMVSCDEDEVTEDTVDQLFRPAVFEASINANIVTFSWVPISNASYSLEISRDSFLFETGFQSFSLDGADSYTIEDLWSDSRYSARIKAVSKDNTVKDSGYKEITFLTGTENIFYTVADDNIGIDYVLLKWVDSKDVSTIVISAVGVADTTISLSNSEISAGEKLIEGLSAGTDYVFKIYLGEMLRGTVSAKTSNT